jgi:starch synthase
MNKVLHVSSECYPAAKAGGMGDVVGALPIYFPKYSIDAHVVIPKYKTKWIKNQKFKKVYKGSITIAGKKQGFTVEKINKGALNYPFYCIDLPGLFDRSSIYLGEDGRGFKDEPKRNIAFQTAVVEWLASGKEAFELLHVHDHMTGLIPFFMKHVKKYKKLKEVPAIFTIHNGAYTGSFNWNEVKPMLPKYDTSKEGLLDWDGELNSLAAAIKCAWNVTTVSPSYMKELINEAGPLTDLYVNEIDKCSGILNGIDGALWNPATDEHLEHHYSGDWKTFKTANKAFLQKKFNLYTRRPVIGFIGRFAHQKGADLLMKAIAVSLKKKLKFNAVILGSGDKELEEELTYLSETYPKEVGAFIGYDEGLARQIYAGCDFLMMPSRFEPCGLNQLYAMRYGTIPIASHKGGLIDTVADITKKGQGIVINDLNEHQISHAIERALKLFKNKKALHQLISANGNLNYSWESSTGMYTSLYTNYLKSKL